MWLTNHNPGVQNLLATLKKLKTEISDIDQDIAAAKFMGNPAPTFHIRLYLLDTTFNRNIEGGQCLLADNTVYLQAMPLLKAQNSICQFFIKKISSGHLRIIIIPREHETLP